MLDSATRVLALVATIVAVIAGGTALWMALRRQARTIAAMADALLGHEEARDRSGAVFQEAQPGLAARMASVDGKLDRILRLELDRRVVALEEGHAALTEGQAALTGRVKVLEDAAVERVVTKAESSELQTGSKFGV